MTTDIDCAYSSRIASQLCLTRFRIIVPVDVIWHSHAESWSETAGAKPFDWANVYYSRYSIALNSSKLIGLPREWHHFRYVGLTGEPLSEVTSNAPIDSELPIPNSQLQSPNGDVYTRVPNCPQCPVCFAPHRILYGDRWCPYCVAWVCASCINSNTQSQATDTSMELYALTKYPVVRSCELPDQDSKTANPFALRSDFASLWKAANEKRAARGEHDSLESMSLRQIEHLDESEIQILNDVCHVGITCPNCRKVCI